MPSAAQRKNSPSSVTLPSASVTVSIGCVQRGHLASDGLARVASIASAEPSTSWIDCAKSSAVSSMPLQRSQTRRLLNSRSGPVPHFGHIDPAVRNGSVIGFHFRQYAPPWPPPHHSGTPCLPRQPPR